MRIGRLCSARLPLATGPQRGQPLNNFDGTHRDVRERHVNGRSTNVFAEHAEVGRSFSSRAMADSVTSRRIRH
jgi:hypothetical protein